MDERTKKILRGKFLPPAQKKMIKNFAIRLPKEEYLQVVEYAEYLDVNLQTFGRLALARFVSDIEATEKKLVKSK